LNRTIAARWRGWPSQPALSLGGLRRRIEIAMLPDDVIITLNRPARARPPPGAGAQLSRVLINRDCLAITD
jgi:hypothetical protein